MNDLLSYDVHATGVAFLPDGRKEHASYSGTVEAATLADAVLFAAGDCIPREAPPETTEWTFEVRVERSWPGRGSPSTHIGRSYRVRLEAA